MKGHDREEGGEGTGREGREGSVPGCQIEQVVTLCYSLRF